MVLLLRSKHHQRNRKSTEGNGIRQLGSGLDEYIMRLFGKESDLQKVTVSSSSLHMGLTVGLVNHLSPAVVTTTQKAQFSRLVKPLERVCSRDTIQAIWEVKWIEIRS